MLEADGTTFRFYGLAPATATINFPPVDVSTYHRVFKEEKLSFPFLSFPFREKGIDHASMVPDVWSGCVTGPCSIFRQR